MTPTPEFSHIVELDALPRGGRAFKLEASDTERKAVAKRLGALAVDHFAGEIWIKASKDRFFVEGKVVAALRRECVATLAEMQEQIDDAFDIEFTRVAEPATPDDDDAVLLEGPEFHGDPAIDIGEILVQQLSLAMNPFPRKDGAQSLAAEFGSERETSPFGQALSQAIKNDKNQ